MAEHRDVEIQRLRKVLVDMRQILKTEGNSVLVLSNNPDATSVDEQTAVEVCADFTDWEDVRYFGSDWMAALRKAADASRAADFAE